MQPMEVPMQPPMPTPTTLEQPKARQPQRRKDLILRETKESADSGSTAVNAFLTFVFLTPKAALTETKTL